jgi:hypothetical protein
MIKFVEAGRCALRAGLAAALLLLAGCVSETEQPQPELAVADAQPQQARYDCGEDGAISVENNRSYVRLVEEDDGEFFDLPASPPTQTSRFGEGGYALVVEGREALWMKGNDTPLTCRR